jgi:hypothetical protein
MSRPRSHVPLLVLLLSEDSSMSKMHDSEFRHNQLIEVNETYCVWG